MPKAMKILLSINCQGEKGADLFNGPVRSIIIKKTGRKNFRINAGSYQMKTRMQ